MSYPPPYQPQPHNAPPIPHGRPPVSGFTPPPSANPVIRARRRRQGLILAAVIIPIWLAVVGAYIYSEAAENRPFGGDCLASAENRIFGGVDIVDCDSREARFKVVATSESLFPCGGREDGVEIVETAKGSRVRWAACVVPM